MADSFRVHRPRDLRDPEARAVAQFVSGEAKKGTKSIGFIPRAGIDQAMQENRLIVLHCNGDRVAFAIFGRARNSLKIFQAWVREDARLLRNGNRLVNELTLIAQSRGQLRLRLWCLDHLPANAFWAAMGFQEKGSRPGGQWARSPHRLWVKPVPQISRLLFPVD